MSEKCPLCSYLLDTHEPVTDQKITPKAGDISVCLNCHSVLIFGSNLKLRRLTSSEMAELEKDADFWNDLIGIIHTLRAYSPNQN